MKYLQLFCLVLLSSCNSNDDLLQSHVRLTEENNPDVHFSLDTDDFEEQLKQRRIEKDTEIYVIDDCEYIVFDSYYSHEYSAVHKGNCKNEFHLNR